MAVPGSVCSRLGLARGAWGQGWAKALVGRVAGELGLWGARRAGGARRGGLGWAPTACWAGVGKEKEGEERECWARLRREGREERRE